LRSVFSRYADSDSVIDARPQKLPGGGPPGATTQPNLPSWDGGFSHDTLLWLSLSVFSVRRLCWRSRPFAGSPSHATYSICIAMAVPPLPWAPRGKVSPPTQAPFMYSVTAYSDIGRTFYVDGKWGRRRVAYLGRTQWGISYGLSAGSRMSAQKEFWIFAAERAAISGKEVEKATQVSRRAVRGGTTKGPMLDSSGRDFRVERSRSGVRCPSSRRTTLVFFIIAGRTSMDRGAVHRKTTPR